MSTARHDDDTVGPSREELAALGRTLVTLVCRIGEELVDATGRCEQCQGTAACDACFAALQATLRYHRLARDIEARLATVRIPYAQHDTDAAPAAPA
jgi:hypothetical protein